ncbi:hypothetical protein [Hydrocarboniphaga effusa]|uniref:hypothetical protein n=1 Tax=Hydrocarboniphaga effusa TaxID=243629 RepID=UPI00398C0BE3
MSAIRKFQPVTMTSLELVDFINGQRKEGEPELRHDSFMAKVPKVLGRGVQKFLDTYVHPQNGQRYQMYRFPKREACLMAMSYSYELQAGVFDRMTELENQKPAKRLVAANDSGLPQLRIARSMQLQIKNAEEIFQHLPSLGELSRQVILAKLINPVAGDDLIPLPQLPDANYSAEQVGQMLGISANMIGRIANQNGVKTEQYGAYFMDKAKHSEKQIPSFRYNKAGIEKLRSLLPIPAPGNDSEH